MSDWAIAVMVMNSVFFVSGATLLRYWLKLRHERRFLPEITDRMEELHQAVHDVRAQLVAQASAVAELQERLDFTERVLTREGRPPKALPGHEDPEA